MTSYRNKKHSPQISSRSTKRTTAKHRAGSHGQRSHTPRVYNSYSRKSYSASKTRFASRPYNAPYSAKSQPFPTKLVALVIGILALIILLTIGIQSCSHSRDYDWNNLTQENGRIVYSQAGQITSKTGIDVSSHQGTIDWNAVANDGIDFAMIRCGSRGYTEGNMFADETFYSNADGAQAAGVPFGVYFFSQAVTEDEAVEEAEYVLQLIEGMNVTCPIAYDLEDMPNHNARANDLSAEQCTKNAEAFCNRIKQAGYSTLVYGNQHDLARYDLDSLKEDIWYAEYNDAAPTTLTPIVMWQYTSTGSVSGIQTNVDVNVLFDPSLIS